MKQTIVAVLVATVAIGILIGIALESRPMPAAVHVAQNSLATELEVTASDYQAITAALQTAWQNRQPPGEAVSSLIERSRAGAGRIGSASTAVPGTTSQRVRIANSLNNFVDTLETTGILAERLVEDITGFSAAATLVREQGPQIVQTLREVRLNRAATDTFELVAGTLDYIDQPSQSRRQSLELLLVTLERDARIDANTPREMNALRTAVRTVLDLRNDIESRLGAFNATRIGASAANLGDAVTAAYTQSVTRIDRARMLLAFYALTLLATVGFFGFRLKQSYQQVAITNAELQALNESLEQRVHERTDELEGALRDLKESQVQLVQAEKMSSLGQLVAGISHEINTPLLYLANNVILIEERLEQLETFVRRSISAYSMHPSDFPARDKYQQAFAGALNELKTKMVDEELDSAIMEARDLLSDCADGLKDLTEMAQSLKDFSRLDRAPVGNFDVNAGLDKTLVIARNIVKNKAEVTRHYGDVPEIECSPSKINQVFLNLITNAAQAIEGTGDIVIQTQRRGDDRVAISISDSGCGIPAEVMDRILDPFFTTKEVGTGTGLGLSIVDDIVRAHDGELEIESEPGKGSRFTVVLPIKHTGGQLTEPVDSAEDLPLEQESFAEAV